MNIWPRRLLALAATLGPLGIVASLITTETVGAGVTIAGVAVGLLALHQFGRRGADPS